MAANALENERDLRVVWMARPLLRRERMEPQHESPGLPDFDDEPTVIQVRDGFDEPPPLPFALRRTRGHRDDESWIYELPEPARDVLIAARYPVESWPRAPRVIGAVAVPTQPIPSLRGNV